MIRWNPSSPVEGIRWILSCGKDCNWTYFNSWRWSWLILHSLKQKHHCQNQRFRNISQTLKGVGSCSRISAHLDLKVIISLNLVKWSISWCWISFWKIGWINPLDRSCFRWNTSQRNDENIRTFESALIKRVKSVWFFTRTEGQEIEGSLDPSVQVWKNPHEIFQLPEDMSLKDTLSTIESFEPSVREAMSMELLQKSVARVHQNTSEAVNMKLFWVDSEFQIVMIAVNQYLDFQKWGNMDWF